MNALLYISLNVLLSSENKPVDPQWCLRKFCIFCCANRKKMFLCLSLCFWRPLWFPSRQTSSLDSSTSTCTVRLAPCTASSTTHSPTSTCPILNLAQHRRAPERSVSAGKYSHCLIQIRGYIFCELETYSGRPDSSSIWHANVVWAETHTYILSHTFMLIVILKQQQQI